ncbi:MAG TPA: tRNA (adenosine(37)-N6)-dimethylallyltransferase MiaA [Vicinamibacteria bacterium]|nr:tRNA (adenosine(37)-N6)-dimethylallyltransferase MiaA [Vicinamibacteria bacterium]
MATPLVAIVGPTASGKSALAMQLARRRGGEIVSCDSLQVYRGFDIGSAKATSEERAEVTHHLVDVADPGDVFSAADYAGLARAALLGIRDRGRLPIVAGGTGLYLRAFLEGLFDGPPRDEAIRRRLDRLATRFGDERLHRLLARVDPDAAERISPRDRVRVIRALEVYRATGEPITDRQRAGSEPLQGFRTLVIGLDPGRRALRRAVEARTRLMLEAGLVDEARRLLARGVAADRGPLRAIGYRQAVAVVRGEMTEEGAERAITTETMRLAKRQMTWFRHQAHVGWFQEASAALSAVESWLDGPERPGPVPKDGANSLT